jgi:hypothetical protein
MRHALERWHTLLLLCNTFDTFEYFWYTLLLLILFHPLDTLKLFLRILIVFNTFPFRICSIHCKILFRKLRNINVFTPINAANQIVLG